MRLLLVEDDNVLRRGLSVALRANGFEVHQVGTGQAALAALSRLRYDLVVLDLGLPDADGLDLLPDVRQLVTGAIIVLSARRDQADKVTALDRGADDYVTKPFGLPELLARIRAVSRRCAVAGTVRTSHLTVNLDQRSVQDADGREVALSPTEWAVLEVLARAGGAPVPPAELLRQVWVDEQDQHRNYVRVYINALRRKLEPDPSRPCCILSQPGRGYWLSVQK